MTEQTRADADLVAAWLGGDQDAFAAIYDRYADGLYGFAMSRLRNRAEAADVVQETFVRAAASLSQLRDRSRLRAWLYSIARNRVIDARRRPMSYVDAEEFAEMPADQPELADVAARSELAELVWIAAEGLTPRDRELLGLHLRHGLDGADLADVVGVSPANLYVSMNRLKERMAKAVGALLIARHGSKDCPELASVLAGWDGTFSLDVRSRVTRHVESCADCTTRRAALITTASFSAGALAVPFAIPAHVRATLLDQLGSDTQRLTGSRRPGRHDEQRQDRWRSDGFPAVGGATRRTASTVVAAAAAVVVMIVATALYVNADRDGRRVLAPPAPTAESIIVDAPPATAAPAEDLAPGSSSPIDAVAAVETTATVIVDTTVAPVVDAVTPTSFGPITLDAAGSIHEPSPVPTSPLVPGISSPGLATPSASSPPSASSLPAPPDPTVPEIAPPTQSSTPDPTTATFVVVTTALPPPAAPPGKIVVLGGFINFGLSTVTANAQLRNDGGQSVGWSAAAGLAAFGVSPSGGSLAPGQTLDIQISVDRASLSEGIHPSSVVVTSPGGGGTVNVEVRVERAPTIGPLNRTPPVVRNSNSCGPTLVNLSITASDESGIDSVEVVWSSDGSFAQRTTLTSNGAGAYVGTIGSFSKLGTNNFTAHVLDNRGNAVTASASVTVIPC